MSTMTDTPTRDELLEALCHARTSRDLAYIDRLLDQLLALA